MKTVSFVIACGALLMAGCQAEPRSSPNSIFGAEDPVTLIVSDVAPSDSEKAKLLAAKEMLFQKLSGRLMQAMSQIGPAGAIKVCQSEAKTIASDVGMEANVRIGRTGVRLRNASNTSPAWAQQLVADRTETAVFAKLSNDHAAALLPIKLQSQCLMCHGPKEQLAPEVTDELAKLYPQDQATGFSEGELRGWFWIELLD